MGDGDNKILVSGAFQSDLREGGFMENMYFVQNSKIRILRMNK